MARPRIIGNDVVLAALVQMHGESSIPPSLRELAARLGVKSASSLYPYLHALRNEGRITWVPGRFRTLELVDGDERVLGRRPTAFG